MKKRPPRFGTLMKTTSLPPPFGRTMSTSPKSSTSPRALRGALSRSAIAALCAFAGSTA